MSDSGPDRSLENRVEDLFSNAVERQVAERRAVGRALEELGHLVKTLDDRLARVEQAEAERDAGLRVAIDDLVAKVEAGAGAGGGAAGGSPELAALSRDLDERLSRLEAADQSRDRELREVVGSITDHVESLSARVRDVLGEGIDQLGARQAETTQALERAVLAAAAEQGGPSTEDLADAIGSRLQVPALDVDAIARQVAERVAEPSVDATALAQEVASRLAPPVVDLDAIAEHVANRVSTPQLDVDELVDLLSVRLATPGLDADELAARLTPPPLDLDAIAERVAGRVGEQPAALDVDDLVARVAARVGEQPAALDVDDLVARVADRVAERNPALDVGVIASAVEGRVVEKVPSALQVASAVDASIRDGLVSVVDDIREELDRLRREVDHVRDGMSETAAGVQPLSARLGSDLGDIADAVEAIRNDLRSAGDDRDRLVEVVRAELGDAAGAPDRVVAAVRQEFEATAEDRQRLLDDVDRRLAEVSASVEERVASLTGLGEDLGRHVGTLQGRLDALGEEIEGIRGVAATMDTQAAQMDRLAIEMPQNVTTALEGRTDALAADLGDLVREFATELGTALATVAERVEEAQGATGQTLGRVDEEVATVAADVATTREDVAAGRAATERQAEAVEQMAADVAGLGETIGRVMGEAQVELEAKQEEVLARFEAALTGARDEVEAATGVLDERTTASVGRIDQAAEVVAAVADGLRERLESALDDIASTTRIDAEAAREEVIAAGARLDLLFDRLAGFERAIIGHLEARDNQLARERQLVTEALVEQLATSMSKGQRKRLAKSVEAPRASEVAARELAPLPVPEALEPRTPEPGDRELEVERTEPVVVPKRSASGEAARKRTGRKATAKRATAKRAPAKKATTKKATAKKATPKKASAKKVSPKKASPKKAAARKPAGGKASGGVTRDDLIAVKGLGPAKADALVEALGSPAAVASASVEQLAAVPGISERLAKAVRDAVA